MKLAFFRIIWWSVAILFLPLFLAHYLAGVLANAFVYVDDKIEELKRR